jgi:subtilisin-like proprotein convertase family protein
MDVLSRTQWIIIILLVLVLFCFPVLADEVYTFSGDFNLRIPADPDDSRGWMDDAVIEVDCHITILALDVGFTLTHSNVSDLEIFLQSPGGTTVCLYSQDPFNGFSEGEDYSQTAMDDEALYEPPFTRRYVSDASGSLEAFNGQDAYGPWRLQIYDAYYYDTGTLESFELSITTPEPATAILLALGTVFAMLLRPRRR